MSMISHFIRKKANGFFINGIKDQEGYSSKTFCKEAKMGGILFPNLFLSFLKTIRPYEYVAIVLIALPLSLKATYPNFSQDFKSFDVNCDIKKPARDFLSCLFLDGSFPATMTTALSKRKSLLERSVDLGGVTK